MPRHLVVNKSPQSLLHDFVNTYDHGKETNVHHGKEGVNFGMENGNSLVITIFFVVLVFSF